MRVRPLAPAIVLILSTACAKVPTQTASIQAMGFDVSTNQLSAQVMALGRNFSAGIERVADTVMSISTDPSVRRSALLFKANAIALVHEAALLNDPVLALFDLWALSLQLEQYYATGEGRGAFGPHQDYLLAGLARAEAVSWQLLKEHENPQLQPITGDVVRTWIAEYPIRGEQLKRASLMAVPDAWRLLGPGGGGAMAAVGTLDSRVEEVNNRLGFWNEYLLKQVRWIAELTIDDVLDQERIDTTLTNLNAALAEVTVLADTVPSMVNAELATALAGVRTERLAVQDFLAQEIEGVLAAVARERTAVMRDVEVKLTDLTSTLTAELPKLTASLDSISAQRLIDSKGVVDHLFVRLAQLLAVAGVVFLIVATVAYRFVFRPYATSNIQ